MQLATSQCSLKSLLTYLQCCLKSLLTYLNAARAPLVTLTATKLQRNLCILLLCTEGVHADSSALLLKTVETTTETAWSGWVGVIKAGWVGVMKCAGY